MLTKNGDLWDEWKAGQKVVITTNIGWDPVDYRNNMGAGMAMQAARRFRFLPYWYGALCASMHERQDVKVVEFPELRLVFLPVKPMLDPSRPEMSWAQNASLPLIERGLEQLKAVRGEVALGLPGAGNGGLDPSEVLALVSRKIRSSRFRVVDRQVV